MSACAASAGGMPTAAAATMAAARRGDVPRSDTAEGEVARRGAAVWLRAVWPCMTDAKLAGCRCRTLSMPGGGAAGDSAWLLPKGRNRDTECAGDAARGSRGVGSTDGGGAVVYAVMLSRAVRPPALTLLPTGGTVVFAVVDTAPAAPSTEVRLVSAVLPRAVARAHASRPVSNSRSPASSRLPASMATTSSPSSTTGATADDVRGRSVWTRGTRPRDGGVADASVDADAGGAGGDTARRAGCGGDTTGAAALRRPPAQKSCDDAAGTMAAREGDLDFSAAELGDDRGAPRMEAPRAGRELTIGTGRCTLRARYTPAKAERSTAVANPPAVGAECTAAA